MNGSRARAGRHLLACWLLACVLAAAVAGPAPAALAGVHAIGLISIPRIDLSTDFFNGQSSADTALGPSHYPWTAMPGHGRTIAIAGHRVTHTHPFRSLGELHRGNLIVLHYGPRFAQKACYRVARLLKVRPDNVAITDDVGFERLVLTTCTPPHFATYRLVVFAPRSSC
jgi:sortase A